MSWNPEEIDAVRERAAEESVRSAELRRIDLRQERADVARRNMRALGTLGSKLARHATEPAMGLVDRVSQAAPWAALGAAAGGALFLVYLALRRKPASHVVVVRDDQPRSLRGRHAPPG